jgi:hypothetical protein
MGGVEGNMLHVVCVNYLLTCTSAACWAPVKCCLILPPDLAQLKQCCVSAVCCMFMGTCR